jgi:hypothetical protein
MKKWGWILLAAMPLMAQRHWDDRNWKVDEKDTIRKTFEVAGGGRKLLVDNIHGFVHVTGYGGSQVQVTAEQQGSFARVYVDGPFRSSNGTNYRGDDYYGYRVVFDVDVQVPYDTEVVLKTVNGGDIQVRKTTGDYEINGLNGGIEMEDVSGSGTVHTLNGKVKVTYTKNPAKPTEFKTLNGEIDVYFQPGLNADLSFQRLNGAIYSDFEVASRPTTVAGKVDGGKFVYRSDRGAMSGRTGAGGPELKFHTLNGTIRLHSR